MPVYMIQAGTDGPVKIGWTKDVSRRLYSLQVAHHDSLFVIREINTGPRGERWLHSRYSNLRMRGEWFLFDHSMRTIEVPLYPMKAPKMERHPIEIWAFNHGVTIKEFSNLATVSYNYLSRIISRDQSPSLRTIEKITKATAGELRANDFQQLMPGLRDQ